MRRTSAASRARPASPPMIVSVTWTRRPGLGDRVRQRGIHVVDDEVGRQIGVQPGDAGRARLVAERDEHPVGRALECLAADDAADRDDRNVPGDRAPAIASRMPGTARIGPIDTIGFDGAMTIASAAASASSTSAVARPPRSPPEADLVDLRRLVPVDEVLLELEPAVVRADLGPDRGRRSSAGWSARSPARARRPSATARSGASRRGVGRSATGGSRSRGRRVGTTGPRRQRGQRLHDRPGLVPQPPAALLVVEAGQRVGDRVVVGPDGESVHAPRSSPVLTTTVRSGPRWAARPSASLAPPTPPASSTTLIARAPRDLADALDGLVVVRGRHAHDDRREAQIDVRPDGVGDASREGRRGAGHRPTRSRRWRRGAASSRAWAAVAVVVDARAGS